MSEKVKLLFGFFGLFVLLQFIPVDRSNGDNLNEIKEPENVKKIFQRACYDCHSNYTNWPKYSYIFPVSVIISHHVKEGRHELNFSEWESYSAKKKVKKASEITEALNEKEMPIFGYTFTHPEAVISAEDLKVISAWEESMYDKYQLKKEAEDSEK